MSKKEIKDIAERAGWTFFQTFVAVYTIGGVDELKSAVSAALAAALSVVKTTTTQAYTKRYGNK